MLAAKKLAPEPGLTLVQAPEPSVVAGDDVLVQVAAAGICGSDLHVYQWTPGYEFMQSKLPVTLGHEFAGHVIRVGSDVTGVSTGQPVVVMPTTTCMKCRRCLSGQFEQCNHRATTGLTRDGAFAQYVTVPERACIALEPGTDLTLAALVEPLCIGDNAADLAGIHVGDTVLVLGPGTIGQAIILGARWRGASKIIAVGLDDDVRLSLARRLGATDTIDLRDEPDIEAAVLSRTNGNAVDVVFEATGNPRSIAHGLSLLKRGGTLVAAGIHAQPITFDLTSFVRNKQQIRAAHGSKRESWYRMIKKISQEPDLIRPMITQELALTHAIEAFELCVTKQASKVILRP
ncbi:MAG: alcohol dehydrogenase catalytic domain-containing protein [Burkholderiaceae bacterium]|nr:alcohol dehydrogenase catalytic domain-containing protein [Burkholderiaceae bacterium]MCD8536915.1 alcohol dehydrogenase catalytic domain-containing protein [Burkholderiaceae bacterium]MCD8566059.1 alcohol dehydrogenase catalytic domain-containing protein [Burkholderiaceae bacterium]